jgi:hypothetical protein
LACTVVLVLSKEFISKPYPMEELQLLLQWREVAQEAGTSSAKLLPVLYHMSCDELVAQAEVYSRAAAGKMLEEELRTMSPKWAGHTDKLGQWAEDLVHLGGIAGLRKDQVGKFLCSCPLKSCACCVPLGAAAALLL